MFRQIVFEDFKHKLIVKLQWGLNEDKLILKNLFRISHGTVAETWLFDHQASGQSDRPNGNALCITHFFKEIDVVSVMGKVDNI